MTTEPAGVAGPSSPCGMTGPGAEAQRGASPVLNEITAAFVAIARTFEAIALQQIRVSAKDMAAATTDPVEVNAMLALCRLQCETAERLKLAVARLEMLCASVEPKVQRP